MTETDGPSSYQPSTQFAKQTNASTELYRKAEEDQLTFWEEAGQLAVVFNAIHRGAGLIRDAVR